MQGEKTTKQDLQHISVLISDPFVPRRCTSLLVFTKSSWCLAIYFFYLGHGFGPLQVLCGHEGPFPSKLYK